MHLVMFDIDETLINSSSFDNALYKKAIKEILDLEGPDSYEDFTYVTEGGVLVEYVEREQSRTISDKEVAFVRDRYIELIMDYLDENPDSCSPIEGGIDLISKLMKSKDHAVAIATGGWGPKACFNLAIAGYDINRMIMATGDDHYDRVEIMMTARERAEERYVPEDGFKSITYVGDAQWDKLATDSLGWRFIGVGDKVKETENHIDNFMDKEALFKL